MNHRIYLLAAIGTLALAGCAPEPPQPMSPTGSPVSPGAMDSPTPRMETLALRPTAAGLQNAEIQPQQLLPEMEHGMKMGRDMSAMDPNASHTAPATEPGDNAAPSALRWTPTSAPSSHLEAAITYTCKMHPKVISNTPGKCPICGMKVVPKQAEPQPITEDHQHANHEHGGQQ